MPEPQVVFAQKESTYYKILGVPENATDEEIKKAYKFLVLKTHPDKTREDTNTAFADVVNAYETLSDPIKRRNYDVQLKQARETESTPAPSPPSSKRQTQEDMFPSATYFSSHDKHIWMQYANGRIYFAVRILMQEVMENILLNFGLQKLGKRDLYYFCYAIDANQAKEFFDALTFAKRNHEYRDFKYDEAQLAKLFFELRQRGYCTESQKDTYTQNFFAAKTLGERSFSALGHKSFDEAIALAHIYKANKKDFSRALFWLKNAFDFKPQHISIESVINVDEFLQKITTIEYLGIFQNMPSLLLSAFKRNNTITEIKDAVFVSDYINSNFEEFIRESKTVKILNLSHANKQKKSQLGTEQMDCIARALAQNISIEELNLAGQPIGDAGLYKILNALKLNPNKLKRLNLAETGLTETGVKVLINFLKTNNTALEKINVEVNKINEFYIQQIKELTQLNREKNKTPIPKMQEEPTAETMSPNSQHRFFNSLGAVNASHLYRSNNIKWQNLFDELFKEIAIVKFISMHFDPLKENELSFEFALQHKLFLSVFQMSSKGRSISESGIIECQNEALEFSIIHSQAQTYFINNSNSALRLTIKNLRSNSAEDLENKLISAFAETEVEVQKLFFQGINLTGNRNTCSWLSHTFELRDAMRVLNPSNVLIYYDKNDFPELQPNFRM